MKNTFCFLLCSLLFLTTSLHAQDLSKDYSRYVDPFIGTQGDGNTFPGASYPFGMVKLGPDCGDLTSNMGYRHDGQVRGFSHTHVSGTGGGAKYGNILVYPFAGDLQVSDYGNTRGKETARVGYFSTELTENKILAELTCTPHTGIHRYTFSKPGNTGIMIDAGSFLGKTCCYSEEQELVGSEITVISPTEISGYSRVRGGWNLGVAYTVYFYALFDSPAKDFGTWKSGAKHPGNSSEFDSGEPVGAWFNYGSAEKKTVEARIGISFISIGKAKENCLREASKISFNQAVENTKAAWNNYLQRIAVESDNETEKTKFYTALYHTMMQPADRNGENPLWTNNIPYYDDFYCIWDTYRTSTPLFSLMMPERESQIVNALVDIYEHEGYLPDARSGNYTGRTQGGSNCDIVVADAILKELPSIDAEKAFNAMIKDAEVPPGGDERKEGRGGLTDYKTLGYVSTDYERAGSRTVEYAANDWAIAQCALKLGKTNEYEKYKTRAGNWENLWKPIESDGAKGFIMPRKPNGEWNENFAEPSWKYYMETKPVHLGLIPYKQLPEKYLKHDKFTTLTAGSWPNFFYESQSWEYSLYVPQDVKQLMAKCGGRDAFISRLDTFFVKNYYNISNEPGFFSPCLYIYAGRQDKTVVLVNSLLKKYFTEKPDGIPGNDDSGAMSSWYAFHSIGLFPNAGQDVYLIASPHFSNATIDIGNGKKLVLEVDKLSDKNIFITSATLNGKPLDRAWFRHNEIKNGAALKLTMGNKPTGWGSTNPPPSRSDEK